MTPVSIPALKNLAIPADKVYEEDTEEDFEDTEFVEDTDDVVEDTDDVADDTAADTEPAAGGCGGAVSFAGLAIIAALGTCTAFVAKKKED